MAEFTLSSTYMVQAAKISCAGLEELAVAEQQELDAVRSRYSALKHGHASAQNSVLEYFEPALQALARHTFSVDLMMTNTQVTSTGIAFSLIAMVNGPEQHHLATWEELQTYLEKK